MSLPKLKTPYYPIELYGVKEKIRIRPFTVAEEKILLMAMEDKEDTPFIIGSIHDILESCVEGNIDVRQLATFNVEYLFVQLRSKSVGGLSTIKFMDGDEEISVDINLDEVVITVPEEHTNKIDLDGTHMITMRYPTFEDVLFSEKNKDDATKVICHTIDKLVNVETNEIFDMKQFSEKEITEFVETFSMTNLKDIQTFFQTIPSVSTKFEYISKDGTTKTKEVSGLVNFFT